MRCILLYDLVIGRLIYISIIIKSFPQPQGSSVKKKKNDKDSILEENTLCNNFFGEVECKW